MRLLGVILVLIGATALAVFVQRTFHTRRPQDVGFALLSWAAVIVVTLGLALTFVPGFLG